MQRPVRRSTARKLTAGAIALTAALTLSACGSGFSGSGGSGGSGGSASGKLTSSDDPISVLIGSSGDAETAAVKSAAASWSRSSGTKATEIGRAHV